MNVTGSFRSSRKNPSSAAAGQSHEALIFFEPSGGCFSPPEIFGSSEQIPVLHMEPC